MINMRSFINLVENQGIDEMAGASASRIVQHVRDGVPFLALSAFRADQSRKENLRRTKLLKDHLAKLPVSYVVTNGEYHEIGQDEPSEEISFFITPRGNVPMEHLRTWGTQLCKLFNQDSFIFGDGELVHLQQQDGESFDIGDRVSFSPKALKDAPGMTKVKGKPFTYMHQDDTKAPNATVYGANAD